MQFSSKKTGQVKYNLKIATKLIAKWQDVGRELSIRIHFAPSKIIDAIKRLVPRKPPSANP